MADQPPIVLVTADELRADALSCYGNRAVETPNVDAIADDGVQFADAYTTSPWCLPARCSLATGLPPHRHGASTNYARWDGRLDTDVPTLYSLLKREGYHVAHFGKCHYAPGLHPDERVDGETIRADRFREFYLELGIDHLELQEGKQLPAWFYDDYSAALDAAGHLETYREAILADEQVYVFPCPPEWHPDAWVGRTAVEYVEAYDGSRPLFVWVSFSGPHYPFDPPAEYLSAVDADAMAPRTIREDEYDDGTKLHAPSYHGADDLRRVDANKSVAATREFDESYWTDLRRHYLANVALVDEWVGDLRRAVARTPDEPLVVFAADHGEMLGDHDLWGKHNCAYRPVWQVPLLASLPDGPSGVVTDATVTLTDVTATLVAAGGGDAAGHEGRDLRRRLDGDGRDRVYAEGGGFAAVTDGRRTYVRLQGDGETYDELYDLDADPDEFEDLSDDPSRCDDLADCREDLLSRYLDAALPFRERFGSTE